MEEYLQLWEDLEADSEVSLSGVLDHMFLIFPDESIIFEPLEEEPEYVDDEEDFHELDLGDFI